MIKIVTDSTSLISEEVADKYGITVIPLNVIIGNQVYKDGITMNGKKLNEYINENPDKAFPTTSQPAVGDFIQVYDELGKDGSKIISIHMTDILSGTFQSAEQAARISESDVTVINSHTIDQGLMYEVIEAAKMAQSGKYSKEQIVDHTNKLIKKQTLYVAVSTLQNLVRGGRISRVSGMVSKLFDLHVVLQLTNEELKAAAKGRGKKTLKKWIVKYLNEIKDQQDLDYVGLSYTGSLDYPEFVQDEVRKIFPEVPIKIMHTGSIVSVHVGNNACGLIFFRK